jgi:hypothetical protein
VSGFLSIGHFGKDTSVQALGSWCALIILCHNRTATQERDAGDAIFFLGRDVAEFGAKIVLILPHCVMTNLLLGDKQHFAGAVV